MSSSGLANDQARALLHTLCNFILPFIQIAVRQTRIDAKQVTLGVEADELVIELENFISGVILRSQPHSQETVITTALTDFFDYLEEANWLWDLPAPNDQVIIGGDSNGEGKPEEIPRDQRMIEYHKIPQPIPLNFNDKVAGRELQQIRRYITQEMPIRLLCFKPYNSELNISLLERAGIYDYLAQKFLVDFYEGQKFVPDFWVQGQAEYAILSHTWTQTPGELTYGDWQKGLLNSQQTKWQKIINFCKTAWENHGLTLGWVDTVCINKDSSAELDESIRSMYAWYRNADVCITYLAATNILSDMHNDPWFTRGWTFQELVAPSYLKFYSKNWNQLSASDSSDNGDKGNHLILEQIRLATTMTPLELQHIRGAPISRRMQLAATRQVTRKEDIAYCLMGIFDVSISTAYGEGAERAFFRLIEEIFRSTKDVSDIFNWAGSRTFVSRQPITSLFPSRPADYLYRSSNNKLCSWRPIKPLTLTHLGLRTPILLMPTVPIRETVLVRDHRPTGDYYATVLIAPCARYLNGTRVFIPNNYHLLDQRAFGPEGVHEVVTWPSKVMKITLTFGALNVEEHGTSIRVPKTCFAILLEQPVENSPPAYEKVFTEKPIVFDLKRTENNSEDDEDNQYYHIQRSQLARHGMQLVTLIL